MPGDLFEQNVDGFGNKTPDRTRPIYGPKLIAWMQANKADALLAAFGTTDVSFAQAYEAFAALPELNQRRFLLDGVYFNELAAPSDPAGNSYLQYGRGYRAVDALFPASLGYTQNVLDGSSNGGTRVQTGNLDLRLATIETTRNSQITLLGPGGDALLGSVVRTSAQAASLAYVPQLFGADFTGGQRPPSTAATRSISRSSRYRSAMKAVLTLRGGAIHSFTDGDLRLNQSRLFTQDSGNIVLWSSNGDLNAGQGPKSAGNVPPIVLRFNPDGRVGSRQLGRRGGRRHCGLCGHIEARSRGRAGSRSSMSSTIPTWPRPAISSRHRPPARPSPSTARSIAAMRRPSICWRRRARSMRAMPASGPRGDIFVAAAQVANADNFKVGGVAVGVPSLNTSAAPALPASAASALAAMCSRATRRATPASNPAFRGRSGLFQQ